MFAHEASDFFGELIAPLRRFLYDHKGLDRFSADGIWHADRSSHYDGGMANQHILYLRGADTITATCDDVIGAALKPEIALLITGPQISSQQPVIGVFIARGLFVVPVFEHHHGIRPAKRNVADRAGRNGLAGVVDDRGDMPWYRSPDRTGLYRHDARIRAEHKIAFSLAEHLVDRQI